MRTWTFMSFLFNSKFIWFVHSGGTDAESWCLNSEHIILHANSELYKLSLQPADISSSLENINDVLPGGNNETGIPNEGDTIGIAYDHIELNFYLNGKKLDTPVLNVKGTVYPALFGKGSFVSYIYVFNSQAFSMVSVASRRFYLLWTARQTVYHYILYHINDVI